MSEVPEEFSALIDRVGARRFRREVEEIGRAKFLIIQGFHLGRQDQRHQTLDGLRRRAANLGFDMELDGFIDLQRLVEFEDEFPLVGGLKLAGLPALRVQSRCGQFQFRWDRDVAQSRG